MGYQTPEALGEAVKTLYETQIIPARRAGLAADVYTLQQLIGGRGQRL
ncbi:MAG: hypothetical protein ACLU3I_11010 [Acutalibacteraceae bacterium]